MKSNEFRIGNLVNIEGVKKPIKIFIIDTTETSIMAKCKAIPLTEEWLIILGFEKKGSFYRIENSRFVEIIIHDDGIDVCNHSVYLPHIKSVHQLQNLYFALVNSELQLLEAGI